MGAFLEREKLNQALFKLTTFHFSDAARADGLYRGRYYQYCLPSACAYENLYAEIREAALNYFAARHIPWRDGRDGLPSNHLCDPQVWCVNFLFPFAHRPAALAALLRPVFPSLRKMLPVERGQYVAFHYTGTQVRNSKNSRPRNTAPRADPIAADAAVLFERRNGERQLVLIDWQYTGSYSRSPLEADRRDDKPLQAYRQRLTRRDSPLDRRKLPSWRALLYEPFYRWLRLQLRARELERAREHQAKRVSVLYVAPAHNKGLNRITSPRLEPLGRSPAEVWSSLLRRPDRFADISTEELFARFPLDKFPALWPWSRYINKRYSWLGDTY